MKKLVVLAMLTISSLSFAEGMNFDIDCPALAESETRTVKAVNTSSEEAVSTAVDVIND
jgi:hypothetical protein